MADTLLPVSSQNLQSSATQQRVDKRHVTRKFYKMVFLGTILAGELAGAVMELKKLDIDMTIWLIVSVILCSVALLFDIYELYRHGMHEMTVLSSFFSLVAMVVAIYHLLRKKDPIPKELYPLMFSTVVFCSAVVDFAIGLWILFGNWLRMLAGQVKNICKYVAGSIWKFVKKIAGSVWGFVKKVAGSVWGFVKMVAGSVWGFVIKVGRGIQNLLQNISEVADEQFNDPNLYSLRLRPHML